MRRKIRAILAVLTCGILIWACARQFPRPLPTLVVILEAQSLPLTRTLVWTDDTTADPATGHTVTLDAAVIGSPSGQSQQVTFATLGTHTLTVTETNLWGTSPPATLVVKVKAAAVPVNLNLQ